MITKEGENTLNTVSTTTGQYGSGCYDFVEISAGNHNILITICNGYHISIDTPAWFDPSIHSWPQVVVKNRKDLKLEITRIINKINALENTNFTPSIYSEVLN